MKKKLKTQERNGETCKNQVFKKCKVMRFKYKVLCKEQGHGTHEEGGGTQRTCTVTARGVESVAER